MSEGQSAYSAYERWMRAEIERLWHVRRWLINDKQHNICKRHGRRCASDHATGRPGWKIPKRGQNSWTCAVCWEEAVAEQLALRRQWCREHPDDETTLRWEASGFDTQLEAVAV